MTEHYLVVAVLSAVLGWLVAPLFIVVFEGVAALPGAALSVFADEPSQQVGSQFPAWVASEKSDGDSSD